MPTLSAGEWYKYLMLWKKTVQALVAGTPPTGSGALAPTKDTVVVSATGVTLTGVAITAAMTARINREGATVADFTDTTDTAVGIIGAIPSGFAAAALAGSAWTVQYINTTGNTATIAAGTGVTLAPVIAGRSGVLVPRLSVLNLVVTQTSSTTVTLTAVDSFRIPPYPDTLPYVVASTVGVIVPFRAPSAMKYLLRTGPTAAFTDTTDTAANMILDIPIPAGLSVKGLTWTLRYINNTGFLATFAGGTGVTMDAVNSIPPDTFRDFIYTITNDTVGTQAITVTNVGSGSN